MTQTLEYIEAYFQQTLNEAEKRNFETRCEKDEDFAREVAFYITSRQVIKEELLRQKQVQWKEENKEEERLASITPVKKLYQRKWFIYAAACLILAISVYLFEKPAGTQQLAKDYISKNYTQLSQTMNGDREDSLQLGIASYNNEEYDKALLFFKAVAEKDTANSDAKKYMGLVYLLTQNYDKALEQFDDLANRTGLFSNPGLFLKAVTLLERNNEGDREQAEALLQQVKNEKLDGSTEAEKWLKKF